MFVSRISRDRTARRGKASALSETGSITPKFCVLKRLKTKEYSLAPENSEVDDLSQAHACTSGLRGGSHA